MERRSILYIGNKLSKHGFTPTGIEYLGRALENAGFNVKYASDKVNPFLRLLHMMGAVIQHRRVDIVLIDTYSSLAFYYAVVCSWLCSLLKTKYVLILRGGDFLSRKSRSPGLTKGMFLRASSVVSVSKYLQEGLKDFFPTHYIPNTIPLTAYAFCQRKVVTPALLWVRSFHQIYNPELAIRIMEIINAKYPGSSLVMIGPDKDGSLATTKKVVQDLGLDQCVRFTGKLEKIDWIKESKKCNIFVNTTNFDNMPVSVVEAMALGLPVVSTRVGGIPFLLEDGVDGLLVAPGDAPGFVSKIELLMKSQDLVNSLSQAARHKVEAFDESKVATQWTTLLDELN